MPIILTSSTNRKEREKQICSKYNNESMNKIKIYTCRNGPRCTDRYDNINDRKKKKLNKTDKRKNK